MATVIAVANQKGGVGKTTSTINLAHALIERGKSVLIIDSDPQSSLTIYAGEDPRAIEAEQKTLYYGLMRDKTLLSLVIPSTEKKPALLPSSIRLASAEPELVQEWDSASVLKTKLAELKDTGTYDFILIDCPPTLTLLTINALAAANLVLIPVKTDFLSIMGIQLLLETIERIQTKANPDLKILGVLPTMYVERNTHDSECLTKIRESLEPRIHVFEPIKRSTAFDKSAAEARPTLEYLPHTPGAQNYYQLADYIISYE
jgi:chromosome partitioning protein